MTLPSPTDSRDTHSNDWIEIEGARTHNLRSVSCRVPHRRITVVTGVSGSGKSSLAFDTLYAEGQRRYVETLSTYARQFLQQMRKPPVDAVRSLPPSLALRQGNAVNNARSTVGTVTEVNEHLHLLFAAVGQTHCVSCGAVVRPNHPPALAEALCEAHPGERVVVVCDVRPDAEAGMPVLLRQLAADGHRRLLVGDEIVEIDSVGTTEMLNDAVARVVLDRLALNAGEGRLVESLETAFAMGEQGVRIVFWDRRDAENHRVQEVYWAGFRCDSCGRAHHKPIPALFHPQSTVGACAACEGFGRRQGLDESRVVPDTRKTLEEGALACFSGRMLATESTRMFRACIERGIPVNVPWERLSREQQRVILYGDGRWVGVERALEGLNDQRFKPQVRIFLARFRGYTRCASCEGSGLSDAARAVRVEGLGLHEVLAMRLEQVDVWLQSLKPPVNVERAIDALLREVRDRVSFLVEAGLGYLSLERASRTLSGGEMHRVLLATCVGRQLTDTCYVLDEPTAGLHPRDTDRLFAVIRRLRDAGNTVVVVEHDPDVIRDADWILELGPESGDSGGRLVYEGDVAGLIASPMAITGRLMARRARPSYAKPMRVSSGALRLSGASLNNLRDVAVSFPRARLTVVTGVSGSGKSSLISDVLHTRLMEARGVRSDLDLGGSRIDGDGFTEVVHVDQGSVARSSRSCALTFSGAYTPIRELFAGTDQAIERRLAATAFSFNSPGGRCEACEGSGVQNIEMLFMADVELVCERCDGKRFAAPVLSVKWNDKSISDVFEMTIDDALEFFVDRPGICRRLEPLARVGLGYLRLGQPTSQLSGGELQRLKLSSFLADSSGAAQPERLLIFDEPSVGLHLRDVDRLIGVMHALRNEGHTLIVVEHNLDLLAAADHVIDLGPGAGPEGGHVVYEGDVDGLLQCTASVTARYLRDTFAPRPA